MIVASRLGNGSETKVPRFSTRQLRADSSQRPDMAQSTFNWDGLLALMTQDQRVVPVLGSDLLTLPNEGGATTINFSHGNSLRVSADGLRMTRASAMWSSVCSRRAGGARN